jgi:hypothetical protein
MRMGLVVAVLVLLSGVAFGADKFGGMSSASLRKEYGGELKKSEVTDRSHTMLTVTLDDPVEIERLDPEHPKDPAHKIKKSETFKDVVGFTQKVVRDGKVAALSALKEGDYVEYYGNLSLAPGKESVLVVMSKEFRKNEKPLK